MRELVEAARTAFTALLRDHDDEQFYFFALFTTQDGGYVAPTAASEEGLAKVVADYAKRRPDRTREKLEHDLRFSAPDSPYHAFTEKGFGLEGGRALHDACFTALEALDRDGLFGTGAARERVIVNVVYGDMSDERWLAHAERLNPKAALERVLPFLRLHLPTGHVTRWGGPAYQVNALSLSADRSVVAYSGSGGEVGVLRRDDHEAIYEKRRKGDHWASVLAPDATRLYLGHKTGIGALDPIRGGYVELVKCSKPSRLALSPSGDLLAVSTWEGFLAVSPDSKKTIWSSEHEKPSIAFSPDGTRLVLVASWSEDKDWRARATCHDANDGKELWKTELGEGQEVRVAWSPDGETILVSASTTTYGPDGVRGTATLTFLDRDGTRAAERTLAESVHAVAFSPKGTRIGLCTRAAIALFDRSGDELARGTGGQESLLACAFADDDRLLAVGRDVNSGPALLELALLEKA